MTHSSDTCICVSLIHERSDTLRDGEIRAELERAGTLIGPLAPLIAGHARSLGLKLVTNNLGEFNRVPGLIVEDWN